MNKDTKFGAITLSWVITGLIVLWFGGHYAAEWYLIGSGISVFLYFGLLHLNTRISDHFNK